MAILAHITHAGESLPVEILDVFETGDGRKMATVKAIAGQPFTRWTHGGWIQSDYKSVPATLLHGVALTAEIPVVIHQEVQS